MVGEHFDKRALFDIHNNITQDILLMISIRMKQNVVSLFFIFCYLFIHLFFISFLSRVGVCSAVEAGE